MSVYTEINHAQISQFLETYSLGDLISFEGIQQGVENTNYRLTTSSGAYILTLFERLNAQQLPFFIELLGDLKMRGVLCPQAEADKQGKQLRTLLEKPAAIFKCLAGKSKTEVSVEDCAAIGSHLAQLHLASEDYPHQRPNEMGLSWCQQSFEKLKPHLDSKEYQLIEQQIASQNLLPIEQLPQGLIHGDLFKDNVLFVGNQVSGILDFYQACHDSLLLDLAITANDWCQQEGELNYKKLMTLLEAYQAHRPLTRLEKHFFSSMLQAAALRFWLARLEIQHFPRAATLSPNKDADVYKKILIQHLSYQLAF